MNTLVWLALIGGCLLLLAMIASVAVVIRCRPTVEYAYAERGHRPKLVTGWRRGVALSVGLPCLP